MKIFKYLFLVISFIAFLYSCGEDKSVLSQSDQLAKNDKVITETSVKRKKSVLSKYWKFMKTNAELMPLEITELKKLNTKYTDRIKKLTIEKKWLGKTNMRNRSKLNNDKSKEIESLLGRDKYLKFRNAYKQWQKLKNM